jgi:NTE family protein
MGYMAGKLDELEDWALGLNRRRLFKYLDFRVRSAGLIGGNKLNAVLEEHFGDMLIEDQHFPFISIATDLVTGHEVWMRKGRFVDVMRASFALPGIFPPVKLNNRLLIDGALVNPVPVSACQALGAQLTIAVDLNGDLIGKASKPGKSYQTVLGFDVFGDPTIAGQAEEILGTSSLTQRMFRREGNSPSLFGVMVSSLNIIQDRLTRSRLAGDPPDVHIKPRIGHIGLLEFERAEEMIKEGEEAVERKLPEIMSAVEILLTRTKPDM